jgi:hypothetical protein
MTDTTPFIRLSITYQAHLIGDRELVEKHLILVKSHPFPIALALLSRSNTGPVDRNRQLCRSWAAVKRSIEWIATRTAGAPIMVIVSLRSQRITVSRRIALLSPIRQLWAIRVVSGALAECPLFPQ